MQTNWILSAPILIPLHVLTVYAECIYVFLSQSGPRRGIPCSSLTYTALTPAVMNFQCLSKRAVTWKILFAISAEKNSLY